MTTFTEKIAALPPMPQPLLNPNYPGETVRQFREQYWVDVARAALAGEPATEPAKTAVQPTAARCGCPVCCGHPKEAHVFNKHGTFCPDEFDKIPPEST